MLPAPPADQFPPFPRSWYLYCRSRDLGRRPLGRELLGRRIVAYRTTTGQPVLLHGHCAHMGTDLGNGEVVGDCLRCPFHHWEYGPDGRCTRIPCSPDIPPFARQVSFPVVERHGHIYFFNAPQPLFPFPFFPDQDPNEFIAARPFGAKLDCPWYLIGANAFDLQHFRAAHDLQLSSEPQVGTPHPFARRASARFRICGDSLQDRLTRRFAGDEVEMTINDWCGNLMYTTATFRRSRSYGMIITEPQPPGGVLVRVIVHTQRSRSPISRLLLDPLRLAIRRLFIMRFLSSDAARLNGIRYNPRGLIEADLDLAEYLSWLAGVSRGIPVVTPQENMVPSSGAKHAAPLSSGGMEIHKEVCS